MTIYHTSWRKEFYACGMSHHFFSECPACEKRLGFSPSLQCPKEGCEAKRCTAINSPFCFPHTVSAIRDHNAAGGLAGITAVLEALVDLNQLPKRKKW